MITKPVDIKADAEEALQECDEVLEKMKEVENVEANRTIGPIVIAKTENAAS